MLSLPCQRYVLVLMSIFYLLLLFLHTVLHDDWSLLDMVPSDGAVLVGIVLEGGGGREGGRERRWNASSLSSHSPDMAAQLGLPVAKTIIIKKKKETIAEMK